MRKIKADGLFKGKNVIVFEGDG